jgi:hypothetical protein
LQSFIPDSGHQGVSLIVWMNTIENIAPRNRVVHIHVAHMSALSAQATYYRRYGVVVRDYLRIQQGITKWSDLGDDNGSIRQRRCNDCEERLQALRRCTDVIVLYNIVGADVQKDNVWLILFQPYNNVGRDLIDTPCIRTGFAERLTAALTQDARTSERVSRRISRTESRKRRQWQVS